MYKPDDMFMNIHTGSLARYSEWSQDYIDAVLDGSDQDFWPKSLPDCLTDGDLVHVEWNDETQTWEKVK